MAVEFKGRWFAKELILQCIRWYLAYALSYRDLKEMMAERGVVVDHSTIQRWVVRYSGSVANFRLALDDWYLPSPFIRPSAWRWSRFCRILRPAVARLVPAHFL